MAKLLILVAVAAIMVAQFCVVESAKVLEKRQLDSLSGMTFG
nr:venom peptide [Acharia stimulea]